MKNVFKPVDEFLFGQFPPENEVEELKNKISIWQERIRYLSAERWRMEKKRFHAERKKPIYSGNNL